MATTTPACATLVRHDSVLSNSQLHCDTSPSKTDIFHQLCEPCQAVADLILDYFDNIPSANITGRLPPLICSFGKLGRLSPDSCHLCAIVNDIWIGLIHEHDAGPLPDLEIELSNKTECAWKQPTYFRIIFKDAIGLRRWKGKREFESLRLASYDLSEFLPQERRWYEEPRMECAKGWIQHCLSGHSICNADQEATYENRERPKRILELSPNGTPILCESDELPPGYQYVTLSHMWGAHPEKQLQLTVSRLSLFKSGIPQQDLSELYQTAITMTLDLGYRYLWIDSLCILQDSPSDWNIEARRMGAIYSNGICSLSFLHPSEMGFVPSHDRKAKSHCIFRRATVSRRGLIVKPSPAFWLVYGNFHHRAKLLPSIEHWGKYWEWLDWTKWPLWNRAWCLQERLLCRRTIIVIGRDHLLWECAEYQCDELIGPLQDRLYPYDGIKQPTKKSFSALRHTEGRGIGLDSFVPWWEIVYNYRSKGLTRESDRVIALEGVARVFERTQRLTYMAGMFLEHMPHTLLWHGDAFLRDHEVDLVLPQQTAYDPKTSKVIAPSWSWLTMPSHERISNENASYDDTLNRSLFLSPTPSFCWSKAPTSPRPDSAFHDFSDLQLIVKAPTFPATVSRDGYKDIVKILRPIDLYVHGIQSFEDSMTWVPDAQQYDLALVEHVILVVLRVYEPYLSNSPVLAEGLVLASGEEKGTWRRVGWWSNELSPGPYLPEGEANLRQSLDVISCTLTLI